ncbi:MAG: fructose-bisphosphate aldolase [Bacteroidetes bacterium]|nr:fructose-bisphosphate aldolase [Bacteroidota bacterium]
MLNEEDNGKINQKALLITSRAFLSLKSSRDTLFPEASRSEKSGAEVLKPNMVVPGIDCPQQADVDEVASRTVELLQARVPEHVAGIAFLSGGQSELKATAHLQAMNALDRPKPWVLSFSYGRALQQAALKSWSGNEAQLSAGQASFMHRAKMNGAATLGTYSDNLESA